MTAFPFRKAHFIGLAGVGMSATAILLRDSEHLRYANGLSNKECALRRLPRPKAVGGADQDAGKSRLALA